ncbi:hypothetical protein GF382_02170 [Candidatus Falkowbacteria bacterium]|nr:hypothetical protein [Candidatus Falkowbacteria bacterium]
MGLIKGKIFPFFKSVKKILASPFAFLRRVKKSDSNSKQTDLDKKVVYTLSKTKIPTLKQIRYVSKFLSKKEVWLVRVFSFIIFANLIFLGWVFYKDHLQTMPVRGGEYVEALVGAPSHINPLYSSINDVDSDISRLVFSSLFKYDKSGELVGDLARDHEISRDGKQYLIDIRDDARWHNGKPVSVDDIIFTFKAMKNPAYNSPLRVSFSGVEIERAGDNKVRFVLSEKYAPFLGLLTFGIMPQELWSMIPVDAAGLAEINLKPIGSGSYKFSTLVKDKLGNIKAYNLVLNEEYYGKTPFIKKLTFKFFVNFTEAINALNNNSVDGLSYLPYANKDDLVAKDSLNLHKLDLPQIDSIFFNQNTDNKALKDIEVRKALSRATPKKEIIDEILDSDAKVANGPIPASSFAYVEVEEKYGYDLEQAESILDKAGWKKIEILEEEIEQINKKKASLEETASTTDDNEETDDEEEEKESLSGEEETKLSLGPGIWRAKSIDDEKVYLRVSIKTVNEDRNIRVAEKVKDYWERIGVKTNVSYFPLGQIQAEIIEPRDFEALLFSQFLGHDPDSYAFWHSTQTGKGGLNIANYANEDVDKVLEEGRFMIDKEERKERYKKFQELIIKDIPAIFLYSPSYIYVQSKNIKGFDTSNIASPTGRFSSINDWYTKTGRKLVW